MNLQPKITHEPVTIVMVPLEQYTCFPSHVDAILSETRYPFKLIIVEGNAPELIRHELEKRMKKNKNIKIIYSAHRPRLAEAFNLGAAHVRTPYAFFMHNSLKVTPDWLNTLMELSRDKPSVICPYISHHTPLTFPSGKPKEAFDMDVHGFLIKTELLKEVGPFNESLGTPFVGLDLSCWLKEKNIPAHVDRFTVLHYKLSSLRGNDLKLFKQQWENTSGAHHLKYFKEKWNLSLDQQKYLEWLEKKRMPNAKKSQDGKYTSASIPASSEKLDFRKFVQVLNRA